MSANLREAQIAEAIRAAGRTRLDARDTRTQAAVDLSAQAIAARHVADAAGDGDCTGRELVARAGRVFAEAQRLAKVASKRGPGRRGAKASRVADEALVTAACQIRLAALCPLNRPYLHALTIEQIQTVQAEVTAAARVDIAALAVDTHRKVRDQRNRLRAEAC